MQNTQTVYALRKPNLAHKHFTNLLRNILIDFRLMFQIEYAENKNHYDIKMRSPDSPDRQYCSSTTQPHTDSGIGHREVRHDFLCVSYLLWTIFMER